MDKRRPHQFFFDVHIPNAFDFMRRIPVGTSPASNQQFIFYTLSFASPGEIPGPAKSVTLYVADSNKLSELDDTRRVLIGVLPYSQVTAGQFPLGRPLYLRAPFLVLEVQSLNLTVFNSQILSGTMISLDQDADPSCYL